MKLCYQKTVAEEKFLLLRKCDNSLLFLNIHQQVPGVRDAPSVVFEQYMEE